MGNTADKEHVMSMVDIALLADYIPIVEPTTVWEQQAQAMGLVDIHADRVDKATEVDAVNDAT